MNNPAFSYKEIFSDFSIISGYKSRELIPLKCQHCDIVYLRTKKTIQDAYNKRKYNNFCSNTCSHAAQRLPSLTVICQCCGINFQKTVAQVKKTKKNFCSSKCFGTFMSMNKVSGTRRSKLELWLETQLLELYPSLTFHFNRKDTINSELDIYIPSLMLAFELNGIFHYEPIFGEEKLDKIQNNDSNKFQKCHKLNISLCVIDTSKQKTVNNKTSKKFLDIITKIINERIETPVGIKPT